MYLRALELPQDVVDYLLDNPSHLKELQDKIEGQNVVRQKLSKFCMGYHSNDVPATHGVFCASCWQECQEDPDAFK